MIVIFKGRKVEVSKMEYGADFVDSYIEDAFYVDTEEKLTEDEMNALFTERNVVFYEYWLEYQYDRAHP